MPIKPRPIKKPVKPKTAAVKPKTAKRPAKRINYVKEIKNVSNLKKPNPQALTKLTGMLERRHNTITRSVTVLSKNLHKRKFNPERIQELKKQRLIERKKIGPNEYSFADILEKKINAGYTPAELLKAGYTPREVSLAIWGKEVNKR